MELPFSAGAFFDVFVRYNEAVWPLQWVLHIIGVGIALLLLLRSRLAAGWIFLPLAALWAWMALVYHWGFFRAINLAATVFAVFFLLQAGLLLLAFRRVPELYIRRSGWRHVTGLLLILYALVVYPGLNLFLGDHYPAMVTFGLPCPTTIFTLGVLAVIERPRTRILAVIPVLWAMVGGSAAWLLDVEQDYGLLVAGLLALGVFSRPGHPVTAH